MTVPRDRLVRRAAVALAVCCMVSFAQAPSYTSAGIVNAASNQVGLLAPNGLVTIYGQFLSDTTAAITAGETAQGTQLPYAPGNTNTHVLLEPHWAYVIYVSPTQINFLVPSNVRPGRYQLKVVRGVVSGPGIAVDVAASAPGLFLLDLLTVIATHADGRVVTTAAPAEPGEVVVLYATGLGVTDPAQPPGAIASVPAVVANPALAPVYLSGKLLPASSVYYTGLTPGFAGLYQINIRVPADLTADPEVRVGVEGQQSPPGLFLPLKKP
jgi:uncharacterized protein (TIGR03437 family)